MNHKNRERYFVTLLELESEHMLSLPEDLPRFKNGRVIWEPVETFSTIEFEEALAYFRQRRDEANNYIESIHVLICAKKILEET